MSSCFQAIDDNTSTGQKELAYIISYITDPCRAGTQNRLISHYSLLLTILCWCHLVKSRVRYTESPTPISAKCKARHMHPTEKDHHYVFSSSWIQNLFKLAISITFSTKLSAVTSKYYLVNHPNSPLITVGPADEKWPGPICNSCVLYVNKKEHLFTISGFRPATRSSIN